MPLQATAANDDSVALLREGTEALVGVLAIVTGVGRVDFDESLQ